MRRNTAFTYGSVAKWLHWSIALLLLSVMAVGIYVMEFNGKSSLIPLIPVHKAFGLTVLALVLFRIYWRSRSVIPDLPDSMMMWQKQAARAMHYLLYAGMLAMPISGWIMSSGAERAVSFWLFEVPPLPVSKELGQDAKWVHNNLWLYFLICIGLHAFSSLVHHFYYRDTVLKRMLP